MKTILVIFDSLAKRFLPPYGDNMVHSPAFTELAKRSVMFEKCYVGSMPCIPARRELHTGRHNFLHRSWGPIEPFDDSMPDILRENGIYSHLASDHYHYWEDGGATYHNRYSSWEIIRGQEGDKWKGEVQSQKVPPHLGVCKRQDIVNRKYMREEKDTPQYRTFSRCLEFIEKNHTQDNWFLQIECFDPHPPFYVPEKYCKIYHDDYKGPQFDWPNYAPVCETKNDIEHCRKLYAALVSMCSHSLGRVMEAMDAYNLWKDTLLIVTTDHGFLLGEYGWWAFVRPPFYDAVANIPLFIWDPRIGKQNERNSQLVQTCDIPATILDFFGARRPADMQGISLKNTIACNAQARSAAMFGVFGGHVNCTDGRYVYMRAPVVKDNEPLYEYTIMPAHMNQLFSVEELKTAELAEPFSFTKGIRTLKIKGSAFMADAHSFGHMLFDLKNDPEQQKPLNAPEIENMMIETMVQLMKANDAPTEQYSRLGLTDFI